MRLKHALLHNVGWKIITMVFTFVSNILIVRLLGVKDSADFFYTLAIFTLLSTVFRLGLENGIVYYTAKFPKAIRPLTALLFVITFIQIAVTWVILRYFVEDATRYTLLWS